MTAPADKDSLKPSNFLRQIIERDLEQGTYAQRKWAGEPADAARHEHGSTRSRKNPYTLSTGT
jgi:glutaminyl-tRNA synthetase